jgi:hypothetical protein
MGRVSQVYVKGLSWHRAAPIISTMQAQGQPSAGAKAYAPSQPSAETPCEHLRRLGDELKARTEEVVRCMASRSADSGVLLDAIVEERFRRVGAVSTIAVARRMAGRPRPSSVRLDE